MQDKDQFKTSHRTDDKKEAKWNPADFHQVTTKSTSSTFYQPEDNDILRDIHFMVNDGMRFIQREDGGVTAVPNNMSLEEVIEEISQICIKRFRSKETEAWIKKHPTKRVKFILDYPEKE